MLTVISCRCWSITRAEATRQPFLCLIQMARLPHHLQFLVWDGELRIFLWHHGSNWSCIGGKVQPKFSWAELPVASHVWHHHLVKPGIHIILVEEPHHDELEQG